GHGTGSAIGLGAHHDSGADVEIDADRGCDRTGGRVCRGALPDELALRGGYIRSSDISRRGVVAGRGGAGGLLPSRAPRHARRSYRDRKSTRLNSSHVSISYAVFCLKKKKND